MNNLKNYIDTFKSDFSFDELERNAKTKGTQKPGQYTEAYFSNTTEKFFENKLFIVKAGSQQYPDFLILLKSELNEVKEKDVLFGENFDEKNSSNKSIFNFMLDNEAKFKTLLKFEIKSKKDYAYSCNDTLPDPTRDIIYVFFDRKEKQIYFNTSKNLAKKQPNEIYIKIVEQYKKDKDTISKWRSEKREEWKGIPINSAPRMNYSINGKYVKENNEDAENVVIKLLKNAKWEE